MKDENVPGWMLLFFIAVGLVVFGIAKTVEKDKTIARQQAEIDSLKTANEKYAEILGSLDGWKKTSELLRNKWPPDTAESGGK